MAMHRMDQVLKSPLLGTEVKIAVSGSKLPSHQRLLKLIPSRECLQSSNEYHKFFLNHFVAPHLSHHDLTPSVMLIWKAVANTWSAPDDLITTVSHELPSLLLDNKLVRTLEKHLALQEGVIKSSYSEHESMTMMIGNLTCHFSRSLVLVIRGRDSCLMTFNHYLSVADTYRSRVYLIVAGLVEDMLQKWPASIAIKINEYIEDMDTAASKLMHDDYFDAVKSIYPYSIGKVLQYHNKELKSSFHSVTEPLVGHLPLRLLETINTLAKDCPQMALELFSVSKCFFFPEIDIAEGSKQQFAKMRRETADSTKFHKIGGELLNVFRAEYIRGHVKKHSAWPSVTMLPKCSRTLRQAQIAGEWPKFGTWKYADFEYVQLEYIGRGLEFEPDLSDIIKDTAIIEDLDRWSFEYNQEAYRIKFLERLKHRADERGVQRLILALLRGDLDDIKGQLQPFMTGMISRKDLITVLVPKEKELKVKGRYFPKQSCRIRLYQVLAELNLKKFIMPYLRMHSMTTSSTQLSHILDRISSLLSRGNRFIINLDYESWSSTFRPELQDPLCRELDRMFGSDCFYQVGSWMPSITTFIMQDRFNPPRQDDNGYPCDDMETCAQGTATMGEGMRQKLWTILTACLELVTLEAVGIHGEVLGQGDNQTILITPPRHMSQEDARDVVIKHLQQRSHEAGLVLKPEECWSSDILYEYGKKLYYDGVPVPNFLKIFSRISDSTGEVYPNVYSRLACLSSSCLSASQSDYTSWPSVVGGIVVYVIEIVVLLPEEIYKNHQLVAAIGLVGPILGGLPSPATLPSAMLRGVPDPLTFQLSLLKSAISIGVSKSCIHQVAKLQIPNEPRALALCSDPTCLNIIPLRRPEIVLKTWIEESLSEMMGSSRVLRLMKMDITAKGEVLAKDLFNMEPKYPRLMSYLFTKSNVVYGLSMLDKFQKSSTVIGISQTMSMRSIIAQESRKFKDRLISSILAPNTTKLNILDYLQGCSVVAADKLRQDTWGVKLEGVSMPFIAEQFHLQETATSEEVARSIIFRPDTKLFPRQWTKRGSRPLYIGSRTHIKVNRGAITGLPEGKIGKMAEDLILTCNWIKLRGSVGGNMANLLLQLLKEKGVTSPTLPVIMGGTLTHRLPTASDDRAGLAGNLNVISTHINFTTNYMTNFTKSQEDYTIHFQAAFLHGLNLLASKLHYGTLEPITYYLTTSCKTCTSLIEEGGFELTRPAAYKGIDLKDFPSNYTAPPSEWIGDPAIAAAYKLGFEIFTSLHQESRGLATLLDSDQSPQNLERLSLSHLSLLSCHLLVCSFWFAGSLKRGILPSVCHQLKLALFLPQSSPTLRWVCDVIFSLADGNQVFDLAHKVGVLQSCVVKGTSPRNSLIVNLLLSGLAQECPRVTQIMHRLKFDKIQRYCENSPDIDSLLGMLRPLTTKVKTECNAKETLEFIRSSGCQMHTQVHSLPTSENWHLAYLLKAFIALYDVPVMVVSGNTPYDVILDLCHVIPVVVNAEGDPGIIEKVEFADLCGAVSRNLKCELSLSTLIYAKYYYDHSQLIKGSIHYKAIPDLILSQGPCETTQTMGLFYGDKWIDLSDVSCKPYDVADLCPSVCPVPEAMYKSVVEVANSCLGALEDFPGKVLESRRAESEWTRTAIVRQEVSILVQELHEYLNILRLALGLRHYKTRTYYLRLKKDMKHLSTRRPGNPILCKSSMVSLRIQPDPSVSLHHIAHLL